MSSFSGSRPSMFFITRPGEKPAWLTIHIISLTRSARTATCSGVSFVLATRSVAHAIRRPSWYLIRISSTFFCPHAMAVCSGTYPRRLYTIASAPADSSARTSFS